MKIVISNYKFDFDLACRLLKLKHTECPFVELAEIWDDIVPLTFKEIAQLQNLEERRVGMLCLGIDRLIKEVQPTLISSQTLKKSTMWVDANGKLVHKEFDDTYELYKVSADYFNQNLKNSWQKMADSYFVKCKDTSTDREYLIWVDRDSVARANKEASNGYVYVSQEDLQRINAIQCIAWTIQTTVKQGDIEKIIRQGDCVLIKPIAGYVPLEKPRHLNEVEYKTLLVAES